MLHLRTAMYASLAALVLVLMSMTPSAAAAGTSVISASVSESGCALTVTYVWTGFQGSTDTASIVVFESGVGQIAPAFSAEHVKGKGGSITHTYALAPALAPNTFEAVGELFSGRQLGGLLDAKLTTVGAFCTA